MVYNELYFGRVIDDAPFFSEFQFKGCTGFYFKYIGRQFFFLI